jgi:hypothetical protein
MTSASEFSMQQVLQIENDERILDFFCEKTGMPLWPLVRMSFLRFIISDRLFGGSLQNAGNKRLNYSAIPTLIKAAAHNLTHGPKIKAPVTIMGTGVGNYMKDGAWFNRLTDYFYFAEAEKSLVVEDTFEWRWPYPRHNQSVLYHAPIQVAAFLAGKISRKDYAKATKLIALLRHSASRELGWELGDARASYLVNQLAIQSAGIPFKRKAYQRLLTMLGTRLLIKEEACYGSSSVLISTAKEMGIVTAEYQHGAISSGHFAYNIASILTSSPAYRKTLPDHFLSYGTWWGEQISVPINKFSIGNPHRTEQLHQYSKCSRGEPCRDVLVLGNGFETKMYLELALNLAHRLGDKFRVVFRPHPFERSKVQMEIGSVLDAALVVDDNSNIYQSFTRAYAVVGENTTGLFEAIGLAKKIYAWDTPKTRFSIDGHPFPTFTDVDDLEEKLSDSINAEIDSEEIWAANWKSNYRNFLSSTLSS